jgi:hypothetical protein
VKEMLCLELLVRAEMRSADEGRALVELLEQHIPAFYLAWHSWERRAGQLSFDFLWSQLL